MHTGSLPQYKEYLVLVPIKRFRPVESHVSRTTKDLYASFSGAPRYFERRHSEDTQNNGRMPLLQPQIAKARATEPIIPDIPRLFWLADNNGSAKFRDNVLTMKARGKTDWYNGPAGVARNFSAPVLVFPLNQDCQFSVRVAVQFEQDFDAGFLFVHQTNDEYAKLCFERSPQGENKIVTVVTRDFSDDADGPVIEGASAHLKVSRNGAVIAFHFSNDGKLWRLARLFRFRDPTFPTTVGIAVQSPVGHGCTAMFDQFHFSVGSPPDPRLLSKVLI